MLNEDYRDMLYALSEEKVRFILVGAYALAAHGFPRATMDIDIWVMPSPVNADRELKFVSLPSTISFSTREQPVEPKIWPMLRSWNL